MEKTSTARRGDIVYYNYSEDDGLQRNDPEHYLAGVVGLSPYTLILEKNKKIDIVIEKNPTLTVYQWTEDGNVKEVTLNENQITVPSNNGHYIYEVVGKWSNGEATYIFDIEIK